MGINMKMEDLMGSRVRPLHIMQFYITENQNLLMYCKAFLYSLKSIKAIGIMHPEGGTCMMWDQNGKSDHP